MPTVRTVDGQAVEILQKTSILITIFAALAWLAVGILVLFALFFLVIPFGFIISIVLLVVAIIPAIGAKVLTFLRTKADMSVESANVVTVPGSGATLRRDRSFWITLEMVLSAIAGIIVLASFSGIGAAASVPLFSGAIGIIVLIVGLLLLAYIFVLNFLRKKLVIPSGELVLVDTVGRQLRLRRHTSVWITLGMVLSVILSLYVLYVFATSLNSANQYSNLYSNNLGNFVPGGLQFLQSLPYVGPGLTFVAFLFSLVDVAVLNFLRTKVNLEEIGTTTAPPTPMATQPSTVAPVKAVEDQVTTAKLELVRGEIKNNM